MPTQLIAGDNQNEASFVGSNDGAIKLRVGPAGAKADGLSISSIGDVAALGKLTQQGGAPVPRMLLLPAKATTSGTFIDFSPSDGTGIPSWTKKITVMLSGVSTNGTSAYQIQIGAGSLQTTGYESTGVSFSAPSNTVTSAITSGFAISGAANTNYSMRAIATISLIFGTSWVLSSSGAAGGAVANGCVAGGGGTTLSGPLDRIRITTTNGTDVFDNGAVSILVEGYE